MCGNPIRTLLLTGGIGSGKSAVAALLREKGFPVFDCDASAKTLYDRDPSLVADLEQILGTSLRPGGVFDRKALSRRIFSDPQARETVECRVHPAVLEDFLRWKEGRPEKTVVMESAIAATKPLFREVYDAILLVSAPLEQRLQRVMARDGAGREAVLDRMRAQDLTSIRPDAVINNDLDPETLAHRTEIALKVLHLQNQ